MLRQSSSKNCRSKKQLRPRHSFQAFLLFAVGVWIVYQLARSYGKRQAVVVVTDDVDAMNGGGEAAARRRLGRKGFAGHASSDVHIVEVDVGGQGAGWGAAASDDPLSKSEDREDDGDGDEDQEADEDDGADDADDDLAGDGEDVDGDLLLSQNGDSEDETKTLLGESDRATLLGNVGARLHDHEPKELNRSAASQQTNDTDVVADDRANATPLGDSPLKNAHL